MCEVMIFDDHYLPIMYHAAYVLSMRSPIATVIPVRLSHDFGGGKPSPYVDK